MHKIWDILRLGVNGLLVHKFRSVLAAMGIIFGVCSVIAMLAIGQGAEKTSREYLRELGSNNIIINAVKPSGDQSSASSSDEGAMLTYGLTHADAERLRDPANMPGIRIGVAVHRAARTAYADGRQIKTDVIATSPDYLQVANIKLTRGRFIEPADLIRRKSYCVITETLARKLYDYRDPIGRIVDFNSEPFLVVGVLQALPKALAQQAGDAAAIIPLTTDVARFGEMLVMSEEGSRTIEQVDVSQLVLQMEDEQAVLRGAEIARSLLTRYHEKKDWHVQVPLELIEQQAKQQRLWTMVLMVVGAVSLVVGGIGIMNIMLASVT
ncbi:MAG: ABC transporter permease, partial [Planctomycetota bacterium]